MISAQDARALMPETKLVVDKAMAHAMDCIDRHARIGESTCHATFGYTPAVSEVADKLSSLGYTVERLESAPNTLRISW